MASVFPFLKTEALAYSNDKTFYFRKNLNR